MPVEAIRFAVDDWHVLIDTITKDEATIEHADLCVLNRHPLAIQKNHLNIPLNQSTTACHIRFHMGAAGADSSATTSRS